VNNAGEQDRIGFVLPRHSNRNSNRPLQPNPYRFAGSDPVPYNQLAQINTRPARGPAGQLFALGQALFRRFQHQGGVESNGQRMVGSFQVGGRKRAVPQSEHLLIQPARAADPVPGHSAILLEISKEGVYLRHPARMNLA
jgi:hypothetical protein